ncbi:MAG: D-arabinose 5-phosphate isomerase [Legionellales bacterium]|nr:D-arabinose 5-phosphate isomerase [Legionellales bacterium]
MTEVVSQTESPIATQARDIGRSVLTQEARALDYLANCLGPDFDRACDLINACKGHVVITGIGKSGHIGQKIAATFASTGTPSFFVHAAEALHGDLGMITSSELVIAISYSGQSAEVLALLPAFRQLNGPIIAITGEPKSSLARMADCHLCVKVENEACHLGLAPTSSTTATLALGDALAITVSQQKGFSTNDFAASHPAGRLGKRLTLRVKDVMHHNSALPIVQGRDSIASGLYEISRKALGMAAVIKDEQLIGVFTDGDLRRAVDKKLPLDSTPFELAMTKNPRTISPDVLLTTAVAKMNEEEINGFLVTDENGKLVGAFNIRDVMRTGII